MNDVSYDKVWMSLLDADIRERLPQGSAVVDKDYRASAYKVYPRFLLFCFCEKYRKKHATKWQPLEGSLPAQLYLIEKHHWLPEQAFVLREDKLLLLLQTELKELQLPVFAHQKLQQDFEYLGIRDLPLNPPEPAAHV